MSIWWSLKRKPRKPTRCRGYDSLCLMDFFISSDIKRWNPFCIFYNNDIKAIQACMSNVHIFYPRKSPEDDKLSLRGGFRGLRSLLMYVMNKAISLSAPLLTWETGEISNISPDHLTVCCLKYKLYHHYWIWIKSDRGRTEFSMWRKWHR